MSTTDEPAAPTPSPEDKAKVESLVADCIEAMERGEPDPASRLCSGRPDLLTRVQRRLAHLAKHGLIPEAEARPPETIGPYRIVRELGSGGMGCVYLAEQVTPVRRQVALKVVKLGMDTREVVARFQAERQALALMNHPHIAQVFDAGITAEGRPFFAMEYVAGESMTALCDRRRLLPEQRIRLLATVCRAVQHAHDRGFIHRDLKPGNVLVAAHENELTPKVIDFGIAKATAAAAAATEVDGDLRTRLGQVLGTPEYMSPEQACSGGIDVDTRTDVYSLGVILYELLCGELPFDSRRLRRASRHEMEHILQDELPTQPSKRLSLVGDAVLVARGGERASLQRRVAGELDWITLKALHKQREQRYPSALALAEDLERWLRHEPVVAAPPGRTYRLRKFVQRHRGAVLAAVLVLVSLMAALVTSLRATREARAAQRQEAHALDDMRAFYGLARDAVGNLVAAADAGLADVPQADLIRRQLLADAIGFYEALGARQPDEPELRIDLVAANLHIGTLQRRLGQATTATATLRQCAHDLASLPPPAVADQPRVLSLAIDVPQALAHALLATGRIDEAKRAFEEALRALANARRSAGAAIADLDLREARLLTSLATETSDDLPAAIELFQRAMVAHARAGTGDAIQRRDHARSALLFAEALTRQNRLEEAVDLLADAATQFGATDAAASAAVRETEAKVQAQFARVLRRLGRFAETRVAGQRAIDLRRQLAAEHPLVPMHADEQASGLQFLAQLALDESSPAQALPLLDQAIALRERIVADHPEDHRFALRLVRSFLAKGEAELELWQHHSATVDPLLATHARAAQAIAELQRDHGDDVDVVLTFAAVHESIAAVHEARSEPGPALQEHLAVRTTLEEQRRRTPTNPDVHGQLANVCCQLVYSHYRLQQWEKALAAGAAGLSHVHEGLRLDARHRATHAVVPQLVARISAVHDAQGDFRASAEALVQLVETPAFDHDAREWGAMLLAQHALRASQAPDETDRDDWLVRSKSALQQAIDERGPLPAAAARPGERAGISHTASRQRDFDLHLVLADVLAQLDDADGQARVLDAAMQLARGMPGLGTDRLRNLYGQAAELALRRGEPATAAARLEDLLRHVGPDGRANALVAALLAKCLDATTDPDERHRLGSRAVACLQLGIEKGELSPAQAASSAFAALRGRADYEALLDK